MDMGSLSDWVMVAITGVYAVLTYKILKSNDTAAKAAQKQIEESKEMRQTTFEIQEQNVKLQLFEKRYEIYLKLNKWVSNVETTIGDGSKGFDTTIPNFEGCIYGDIEYNELRRIDMELKKIRSIPSYNVYENRENDKNVLLADRYRLGNGKLVQEAYIVKTAKYCFEDINDTKIEEFCEAFLFATGAAWQYTNGKNSRDERLFEIFRILRDRTDALKKEQILEKMREQLKIY